MGAITNNIEASSTVPAGRLYKALFLDMGTLIPKILPHLVKSVEVVEGDGGPGTVKEFVFGEASPIKSMKQRIDAIDKDTLTFSVIEGDILLGKLVSITCTFTLVPTDGGCIAKANLVFTPIDHEVVPEELTKQSMERVHLIFKAVESYLLANPDAY